jgi:hypothetical protein
MYFVETIYTSLKKEETLHLTRLCPREVRWLVLFPVGATVSQEPSDMSLCPEETGVNPSYWTLNSVTGQVPPAHRESR